tara:strand:- start:1512 stop:1739 length:228 start_codon:yes stop_codon:yes gene_type:complete
MNNQVLITKIEESPSELGEPDCRLVNPYLVSKNKTIEPLFIEYTGQKTFMIHSDKIFTITEPNSELIDKYNKITE